VYSGAVASLRRMIVAESDGRSGTHSGSEASGQGAVSIRNVSKSFRLPQEHVHTLKERALHPLRARRFDLLKAVRDVSLEVPAGEFMGIVGRNGSGKSTLLKCLAGIYRIDEGEIAVNGRLSPFIELGVGFNPDLSARDNVIINAIMLGLSRKQAVERFDDIMAFAELEEFTEMKLKNYSSGMHVRLAFATAVQVDADILLIDEVLAVGDAAFQQKCFDEFTRLQEAGRTLLLVTHDMSAVERFCHRAMLLERGEVVDIGEPTAIARQYNQLNFRRVRAERAKPDAPVEDTPERAYAEVLNAWFEAPDGSTAVTAVAGEPCPIRIDVLFHQQVEEPIFSVTLQNEMSQNVFSTNTVMKQIETGTFDAGTTAKVRITFENVLAPGRYRLFATVSRAGLGADVLDAHITGSIVVVADWPGGGLVDLQHDFVIERV
jgi:ABC-type polysaccharide/polyol phosphate transport system ATPase subunit